VVNAYLMPTMIRYLSSLDRELSDLGYPKTLFIMNSSGGMISSRNAQLFPVRTILSGPAGGVNGAIYLARQAGFSNIITYDMGGTSSDVCLVKNLTPMLSLEHRFSGIPVKTLQMEINTIGAGGGSIAWLDTDGRLKVGPQSAGSMPGPAGYGKGGKEVTITDANLVLGRLGGNSLLAGKVKLFEDLAAAAMKRLSEKLGGIDILRLAEGVIQISVAKMSSAIKEISVEKGHDPRDYVLLPYGGAGPMHATLIAEELGIGSILVPRSPGNLSALGLIISDVRIDDVTSWLVFLDELDMNSLDMRFQAMEKKAAALLGEEGFTREAIEHNRSLDLRYKGQAFELNIPMTENDVGAITTRFHARFHETYGHGNPNHRIELVNLRLTSFGKVEKPTLEPYGCCSGSIDLAKKAEREVYFKGMFQNTTVFEREKLPPGVGIDEPCVIEEDGSTTVVSPGWNARIDAYGNLILKRR
jgi:N-methylhydantoinase A